MVNLWSWATRAFGSANERRLKRYRGRVGRINALEDAYRALSDEALKDVGAGLKVRLAAGETLDDILEDAFAATREAARRGLGQRHYDVQLIGGMVLHEGNIAEMKTGEGKTLVATLPCFLNALSGEPVHVVTVNDYLAARDADWMRQVHERLGLRVSCITHDMDDGARLEAYRADIVYATNNELGFDYLRDNMKYSLDEMVQCGRGFAIVDEVDSILIDEARTPLIISGAMEDRTDLYTAIDALIDDLVAEDYEIDEKTRAATLTDSGNEHIESLLQKAGLLEAESSIYDIQNITLVHHVTNALRAHKLFAKDRDYILGKVNGELSVVIIDEFTGRMMEGRRFSDGLHQALEAKERVAIQAESRTLAAITFQNYFRLYDCLSGMTGTAATEAEEFGDIYGLEVLEIPTHAAIARADDDDAVYRNIAEKNAAIIDAISECQEKGQPVLVGTTSIEKSESLAAALQARNIKHNVLNARYHEQEAHIIAQAGVAGAVTIATNMAGRGTDIQLGGNLQMQLDEVKNDAASVAAAIIAETETKREAAIAAGGLCVIGTERHESRRIDNQLRGRSGRQGDPGRSLFFLSLEDDLMRIFGTERMDTMLQRLGLKDGEAIIHPWINKALERAQKKVETRNFDIRKSILQYDDVINEQRKVVFEQRIEFMRATQFDDNINDMRLQIIDDLVGAHMPPRAYPPQWDIAGLTQAMQDVFALELPLSDWAGEDGIANDEMHTRLDDATRAAMQTRMHDFGETLAHEIQKSVILQTLDQHWRDHLVVLEHLRSMVGLRGLGQRDPLSEFKLEAFSLFSDLLNDMRRDVVRYLMHVRLQAPPEAGLEAVPETSLGVGLNLGGGLDLGGGLSGGADMPLEAAPAGISAEITTKTPRNAPCPCGSGKKYKHCHGKP